MHNNYINLYRYIIINGIVKSDNTSKWMGCKVDSNYIGTRFNYIVLYSYYYPIYSRNNKITSNIIILK